MAILPTSDDSGTRSTDRADALDDSSPDPVADVQPTDRSSPAPPMPESTSANAPPVEGASGGVAADCREPGLGAFRRIFGTSPPIYALLAVESRAPEVIACLADTFRCRGLDEAVIPELSALPEGAFESRISGASPGRVVIAQAGAWAIAFLAVGRVNADHLVALPALAGDLSETLATRTLGLTRDETAGGWEAFADGELEERGGWATDGRMTHFESTHGKAPSSSDDPTHGPAVVNRQVESLGLWIPPLAAVDSGVVLYGDAACLDRIDSVAMLDLGKDPLFGTEAIREASTDSFERPFLDDLLRVDADGAADEGKARAEPPSKLRGMLLRLMGRGGSV